MKEVRVCVKHLFEETTNLTRYSWFERSNLVAYEPGMRRRVAQKRPGWENTKGSGGPARSPEDNSGASSGQSGVAKEDAPPANETVQEELPGADQEQDTDGDYEQGENSPSVHLPTVLVEHRWSFLMHGPLPHLLSSAMQSPRSWFQDPDDIDASSQSINTPECHTMVSQDDCSRDGVFSYRRALSNTKVRSVREAFSSAEFGGRSSVLRCLVMNLDMRYISRTQMNYSFHLSAIAERIVQDGVYYMVNTSQEWNPVICNEPIDVGCALRLYKFLSNVVRDCRIDNDTFEEQGEFKHQKLSESPSASIALPTNHSVSRVDNIASVSPRKADPFGYTSADLRYVSLGPAILDRLSHKTLVALVKSVISHAGSPSGAPQDSEESNNTAVTDNPRNKLLAILKEFGGSSCTDTLICSTLVSLIRMTTTPVKDTSTVKVSEHHLQDIRDVVEDDDVNLPGKLYPFDCYRTLTRRERKSEYPQGFCNPVNTMERLCLCCSKYALCPTVFNEYIIFGGSPATPPDMELGVWIFDSAYTRLKMRDVPVVYHQQVQYSTKKYISIADLNDAVLSTRVLNLRMEFCGRGDWVFDDGSVPYFDGEKERPLYGKVITADDLMQLEFTGTVNQIAKKFFLLQKAFLATGKEGTSRLIFMDPYANIDAGICEDKDSVDLLAEILTTLYNQSPDTFLASANGYYYHEDGFLPEGIEVQRLRNQLFSMESSHYRTAMLADIVHDQKMLLNLSQKMPFLTKCKRVVIGKSRIHGYGLFAVDTINKGELILEYAGVVISDYMADMREAMYDRLLCGSIYMFRLDLNHIIDSTFYGNCARFINHSCDPNTATTNFSYIDEDGFGTHVGIYASKVIPAGEEIYYNYRLSSGAANREVCYCGSYMCTGYMSLVK